MAGAGFAFFDVRRVSDIEIQSGLALSGQFCLHDHQVENLSSNILISPFVTV